MATEEDNFDIDIYGDGGEDYQQDEQRQEDAKVQDMAEVSTHHALQSPSVPNQMTQSLPNGTHMSPEAKSENEPLTDIAQKISSTDDSSHNMVHLPKQAPQIQGLKRQDGADDRYVDPGATTALFLSDLHWWVNDDDIRGWANQSQCEDELQDITFSEHKVNGKSKGQAYVLLKSPQAATAVKQRIESFGEGQQYSKKFSVNYTNPFTNPFKTLPKDGPMRNANNNRSGSGGYGNAGGMGNQQAGFGNSGGYRGNRGGGYNNRGGGMTSYNRGGFQQPVTGGFQGSPMGGFQGSPMGGMQQYGGFQNRGGMMGVMRGGAMGMRGGRGGMGPNAMMGMPMGNMGMSGMGMGMPQVGMQGQYNPAFFQTGQGGGPVDASWNPHGAKRTRQE